MGTRSWDAIAGCCADTGVVSDKVRVFSRQTYPTRKTLGLVALKYVPRPVMVPDVPMPAQIKLISGSCLMICGPVQRMWDFQFWNLVSTVKYGARKDDERCRSRIGWGSQLRRTPWPYAQLP